LDDKKSPPLEEQAFVAGVTVIDIGDVRVARGLSRRPYSACRHRRLVYDGHERRIWCKDCEQDIEPFDGFKIVAEQCHAFADAMERREEAVAKAEAHALLSRAAKAVDEAWRKRSIAPGCPHCSKPILPEDFAGGVRSGSSVELERRRRAAVTANKG
jgi:hypothetical protein